MKCDVCRFAPLVDSEGYQDECSLFEKYGKVWKDGREGCTMNYNHLKAQEEKYWYAQGEYATEWGLEHDFENHGWDIKNTVKGCAHMVGLDVTNDGKVFHGKVYHRHGKAFYKAYRNYYCGQRADFDYMCDDAFGYMTKVHYEGDRYPFYYLTERGLEWLGRQLKIKITEKE